MRRRALFLLFLIALGGCSYLNRPFQKNNPIVRSAKYTLGIVEFDDQGWFFDREQAQTVLETVRQEASDNQSVIVVYVHGWHHNAKSCDQNLSCFQRTLERLHDEVNLEVYSQAREDLQAARNLHIIGIYVGWRGRSLPRFLTFTTFWDRKAAGHRTGGADVREFFIRLGALHRQLSQNGRFTGLVTIGHSFGGAVVENALSPFLLRPLAENVPLLGRRDLQSKEKEREPAGVYGSTNPREEQTQVLEGFGDLVVLVNPAYEASLYNNFHELSRRAQYSPCQAPIMMTLSTENDFPRNHLFPIGRNLSLLRQATRENERPAVRTALGNYEPQWTHSLRPEHPMSKAPRATGSCGTNGDGVCKADLDLTQSEREERERELSAVGEFLRRRQSDPRVIQLAGEFKIRGLVLRPIPGRPVDPNLPFLVVRTSAEIINNHSGFFNRRLVGFLVSYIGAVEAKRLLVSRKQSVCTSSEAPSAMEQPSKALELANQHP